MAGIDCALDLLLRFPSGESLVRGISLIWQMRKLRSLEMQSNLVKVRAWDCKARVAGAEVPRVPLLWLGERKVQAVGADVPSPISCQAVAYSAELDFGTFSDLGFSPSGIAANSQHKPPESIRGCRRWRLLWKPSRGSGRKHILLIREAYAQVFTGHKTSPKKPGIALDIQEEPVSAGKHSAQNPVCPLWRCGGVSRWIQICCQSGGLRVCYAAPSGQQVTAICALLWGKGGRDRSRREGRVGTKDNIYFRILELLMFWSPD